VHMARGFCPRLWRIKVLDDAEQNRERMRVAAPGPINGVRDMQATIMRVRLVGTRPSPTSPGSPAPGLLEDDEVTAFVATRPSRRCRQRGIIQLSCKKLEALGG